MLKYITKFALEIIPSVVATIIGAYIVNHYINTKPDAPPSTVAAVASAAYAKLTGSKADAKADTAKSSDKGTDSARLEAKADAKPAETSAEVSNVPAAGIKAKGVSEKSLADKAAEKVVDVKPTETASLPAETPRHPVSPREKLIARGAPAETPAASQEERRDAADLARAAIERLRANEAKGSGEKPSVEAARETPRIATVAPQASPVRPLPPPISVSVPSTDQGAAAPPAAGASPSYTGSLQPDGRPTPPAEIPTRQLRPLDLRADKSDSSIKDQMSSVAQDMMSAAKSVFHSVLPK
ncbi:hypothetical protein SSBR45G_37030 [Bradyrhizobium sp. SSBR45G]|uniref:hypothetical protein n=1 Tax=unclassified Bradyrhizobium TaxID=2631580 RepID=UPI0023429426|nr:MULTISPECIES: hypothetical protein [unclassified Bradyrhizobium]GLH78794.1 hypothetical protein SSBR45G_37030 [Bradyrhizobium sp. SSBR45G]GLH86492.1 hypothetical protein SSBR45R_39520 [Bradyrhizobium sp. SSBR45R]